MTDSWSDATAQAAAVRSGAVTPLELVDEAIARIESANPQLNTVIHERFERARDDARGAVARRSVPRRAVPDEGRGVPRGGGAVPLRDAGAEGRRSPGEHRHLARRALPRRRARVARAHQPPRDGEHRHHRAGRVRRHPQPVGPRALHRWFERRRGRRGRLRHGGGRARQRHGRLDPLPGVVVRPRRPEAHPGPHDPRSRLRRAVGADDARARAHPFGPRQRRDPRRGPRPRRR